MRDLQSPVRERAGEQNAVEQLYREMGATLGDFPDWSYFVLTSHPQFERLFGRRADRKRKLYNGRIECAYYQFTGRAAPVPDRRGQKPSEPFSKSGRIGREKPGLGGVIRAESPDSPVPNDS